MKNYIFFSTLFILLFSACSSKEAYDPEIVGDDWEKYESTREEIIDTSSNVALLEDQKILTRTSELDIEIAEDHRLISQSGGWIISASVDGNLSLISQNDKTLQEVFSLGKTVASAGVDGDNLAILFADNEMAIYDISSKKLLFKEEGVSALVADSRIVNPYFLNDLVIFATLDGKIVFVSLSKKKRLRTVIVSSEQDFNNIIALSMVQNNVIAATNYKLLSLSQEEIHADYEIRNVITDETNVYVATKQGEILSLNTQLVEQFKIKLPFAHFYGMISSGDKLYVLEKEGYLIVIEKETFKYTVHEVDVDDGFVFIGEKSFQVSDEKILVE